MQSAKLDNCRICGKLFLKEYTDYCVDCYKEVEREFKCVTKFLENDKNLHTTIEEIKESTNVSIKQIGEFIRDGRIFAEDFPNLGYACMHCGKVIKRQTLCNDCFEQFSSDVNKSYKREKLMDEISRSNEIKPNNAQYWQIKKEK